MSYTDHLLLREPQVVVSPLFKHFLVGEIMVFLFPEGMRGPGGPPIYPGLYAVVGEFNYNFISINEVLTHCFTSC